MSAPVQASPRGTLQIALLAFVWLALLAWARPLMLPDEGRYVGVAWGMLRSGDWLTPALDGLPYFHKPPLFYWITAAAMKLLNEMSKPEPQANFSVMVKYGPLNMKAYATGLISDATAAKFPSFPANAEKMVVQSGSWWAENTAKADAAFDDMMNN